MTDYIVEYQFKYKGYDCVIIFGYRGYRCGYIGIPEGHPLYGIDMIIKDESPFFVHGGITYSGGGKGSTYPIESDLWWLGFDCIHLGDDIDFNCLKKYFGNDKRIKRIFKEESVFYDTESIVRTKEFVTLECIKLVDQIIDYTAP